MGTIGSRNIMKSVRMFMQAVRLNIAKTSMQWPVNRGATNSKAPQAKATINLLIPRKLVVSVSSRKGLLLLRNTPYDKQNQANPAYCVDPSSGK
jgi:hypothetical protein